MKRTLIQNAHIVNEGRIFQGSVVVEGEQITEILVGEAQPAQPCDFLIEAQGLYLLPGIIDEHVHFRDPGLTHKADILTESMAAAAGGVTSIMDMPNTHPQTTTLEALEAKRELLAERCLVNHACYFGATNSNYTDFAKLDRNRVAGVKIYMGSSTGNMLVDRMKSLQQIFGGTDLLISAHCEDQTIINQQTEHYKALYPEGMVPVEAHPLIRNAEACFRSSELAVRLANEAGARLHIMHISTARELELFSNGPLTSKRITAEACVPHLFFCDADYRSLGARIKCNPAIKTADDRAAIREAVNNGRIDVIATDHAPHLLSEKEGGALKAASGIPVVQYSPVSMLELCDQGVFSLEKIVEKMCHAPALLYRIPKRGFVRTGYQADLVLVKPQSPWEVADTKTLSKCGWSPFEGRTFGWKVCKTFVNGHLLFDGEAVDTTYRGQELLFTPDSIPQ